MSIALLGIGCESTEHIVEEAPHSSVNLQQGLNAALSVDAQSQGRVTGLGAGNSMAPLYGGNAIVVTNPIDFDDLTPGLVVVYQNSAGHNVVHKLSHRQGRYWVAVGENNRYIDEELVTPENLIGVVYATFHTQKR